MAPQNRAQSTATRSRTLSAILLLAVAYWFALAVLIGESTSADLRAVWLAGHFFSEDDPALVYRMSEGLFTMEPPDAWITKTLEDGLSMSVFPFVYPPLWAWITAQITNWVSYGDFLVTVTMLNRLLIPACFFLAWRILKPDMSLVRFLTVGLFLTSLLWAFTIPLHTGQYQILVSFLILLAIERERAGSPIAAGAALALAASLKIYPLFFALLWLAMRNMRAVLAFAGFGGVLGLVSLAVAPWSFHAAFLNELSVISASYLISGANTSFGPLFAAATIPLSEMQTFTTAASGGTGFWDVGLKAPLARGIELVLFIATITSLCVMAFVTRMRDPVLWGVAAFAISWIAPLSWLYHYMTFLVFTPILIDRLGWRGGFLLVLCVAPFSVTVRNTMGHLQPDGMNDLVVSATTSAGMIALALSLLALALPRKRPQSDGSQMVPGE